MRKKVQLFEMKQKATNIQSKQPTSVANKVVFNVVVLYLRMLITMGISLYSTRLVLNSLGAIDYGTFNLIGGVIAMLSFLNAAMTVSTQRYLSFNQGVGDSEMQKKIFINSWILHITIGIVVIGILLALIPFLFEGFLNLQTDRIMIAKAVYIVLLISVFFTIISTPFTALLNAHENMLWIALVNIVESFFKLVIALSLNWFIQSERLVVYGVLIAGLSIISFLLNAVYCLKNYNECSLKKYQIDKVLIKELGSFAGWNLFANLCYIANTQGINIVFNLFFGTLINAAYGIANQVMGQFKYLSVSLLRAISPQIMKSEGMSDRQRMLQISVMASKLGFFLLAFFAIPCIFEMPVILKLWLKNVPDNTAIFCSLFLIALLINQLTAGVEPAIQSIGKIKRYQVTIGIVALFNLPISYFLLKIGQPAFSVLIFFVLIEVVSGMLKIILLKKSAGIEIGDYFNNVIFKTIIPVSLTSLFVFLTKYFFYSNFSTILSFIISFIIFPILVYFTGLNRKEKDYLSKLLKKNN